MSKDQTKARALAALIECKTLTGAAEKAGIARKTLYNYLSSDPEFAKAYKAAQEQAVLVGAESAEEDRRREREVIFSIMEDEEQPGALRLKAALSVLEAADTQEARAEKIAARNEATTSSPFGVFGFSG